MVAGFGPETITAHGLRNGKYRFRVTEYRGPAENRERLLLSKALVSVYTAVDVKTFEIGREGDGFIRVCKRASFVLLLDMSIRSA